MAKELDEKVEEFLNRPVEKEIPYLFVDASYYKVRDEVAGRYKTKALILRSLFFSGWQCVPSISNSKLLPCFHSANDILFYKHKLC